MKTALSMCYLISRYPAVSHTFILREVLQLRETGWDISCVSVNAPDFAAGLMPEAEQNEQRTTYYLKQHGWRGALMAVLWTAVCYPTALCKAFAAVSRNAHGSLTQLLLHLAYLTEAMMTGKYMRAKNIRHLHVHFGTAAANVGMYVKHLYGVGLSMTIHGPDEFDNVEKHSLTQKVEMSDFIICISSFARSQLMRLSTPAHWTKFHISYLGVDTERYQPIPAKTENICRLLCVGRLTSAKGQFLLLQLSQMLQQAGYRFHLTLIGTGPDEKHLQQGIQDMGLHDCVSMAGAQNQEQILQAYAKTDIFILPSFAEGIPVVLMEAMACGIAVVTSNINGIPELVESGENGFLTPASDLQSLYTCVTQLIDSPALRISMGLQAREKVVHHFQLRRNTGQLDLIFKTQLSGR